MLVKNNYNECLTNLACSIRKYFGLDYKHNTLKYIDDLEKANINAKVDIYHGNTHAFDMILFWTRNAKQAKEKLLKEVEEYFK